MRLKQPRIVWLKFFRSLESKQQDFLWYTSLESFWVLMTFTSTIATFQLWSTLWLLEASWRLLPDMGLIEQTVVQFESAPSKRLLRFCSKPPSLVRKILYQVFQKTSFLGNLLRMELGILMLLLTVNSLKTVYRGFKKIIITIHMFNILRWKG